MKARMNEQVLSERTQHFDFQTKNGVQSVKTLHAYFFVNEREVNGMEKVTLKEYEAAKAAVLYGKEYEEISDMESSVIHKQYICKDGSGVFYERTENGLTEFWSTEHSKSRLYVDKAEDRPAHEEKEEFSENRQKAIKRMYKLVYWFADEMLKHEDMETQEKAEFERKSKEEPDKQIIMVSTSGNNARVMKDCMREARDAAEFLKDRENDIEEWQIAGINAMCDQCNVEKVIPHDLPTAIKGLLCMHIIRKPLWIEAGTK